MKSGPELCQVLGLGQQNLSPFLFAAITHGVLARKLPTPKNSATLYGLSDAMREKLQPKPRTVWQPVPQHQPVGKNDNPAPAPEAAPVATGTESRVCADIAMRQQLGLKKYGTTIENNPLTLREWLQHAYEECLDQANYLKRAIEELDKGTKAKGPRAKINCTTIEKEKP